MNYRITAPRGKCLSKAGAAKFICFAKTARERRFLTLLYNAMAKGPPSFNARLLELVSHPLHGTGERQERAR